MAKLAVVQKTPIFLDKEKSIVSAVNSIEEAATNGAGLVIFTEAFIPGYPSWIWRLRPGGDWNVSEELHKRLLNSAVTINSDDLEPLYAAALEHQVTIVCGIEVGRYAFIAAGAIAVKDVPEYALITGVPGRQSGWMSRHGHILHPSTGGHAVCPESKFEYKLEDGKLRCLSFDDDTALPDDLAVGLRDYQSFKDNADQ